MRIETGWHSENEYCVVKPLHNGCRQVLFMAAMNYGLGQWYISAGIFSCNATYNSVNRSEVWKNPTSTNKNPSFAVIPLALAALTEIEQAISEKANGKRRYIYIDGMDERRLRVYTKILMRNNCGYKKSSKKSDYSNLPMLFKRL